METSPNLSAALSCELVATQQRLDRWMLKAPCSHPSVPCIPDPTFKLLPRSCIPKVLAVFLARLDTNVRAIITLCEGDLAVAAQPVLRAVVESAIDLRYISTNPQTLCSKWCLFEEARRYEFWSQHPEDERPSDYGLCQRETDKRLLQLDRHSPHRNGKRWKLSELTRDWDMSNLAHREKVGREAFGAESAFYGIYKLLSGSLHGGTDSVGDFVVVDQNGDFQVVRGFPGRKVIFVAWATLHAVATTLKAAQRCGAEVDEQVFPQWELIGMPMEQLNDEAAADFKYPALGDSI